MRQHRIAAAAGVIVSILLCLFGRLQAQQYTLSPAPYQYVLDTSGRIVPNACVWSYAAGTTNAIATYSDTSGTLNGNPIVADSSGRFVAYLLPGTNYKFQYENVPCASPSTHGSLLKTQDNIQGVPAAAANVDIVGTAGIALSAGQCVYLSDGSGALTPGQWYKCDSATTYSSMTPSVGFAIANIALGTQGTIRTAGYLTGLSSLTAGAPYFVGTSGAITSTAPAYRRPVGWADTTTSIVLHGNPAPTPSFPLIDDFRLSLTTATCATTADVTAATTLYLTPCDSNRITLFDANSVPWTYTTAEISIAIPATTSQMYDVWAFYNGTAVALELLAWTNDTTRATALARVNGKWTKTGDPTRLYVGSVRTTTVSGQTEDSATKRYVWNMYNRRPRLLQRVSATTTWNYTTATYRQANADTSNQVDVIVGEAGSLLSLTLTAPWSTDQATGSVLGASGIGEDSTSAILASATGGIADNPAANIATTNIVTVVRTPAIGRHFYTWLEKSTAVGTTSWYGTNRGPGGLEGWIQG